MRTCSIGQGRSSQNLDDGITNIMVGVETWIEENPDHALFQSLDDADAAFAKSYLGL